MSVIVSNDPGRRSEYVQAKARQILVIQQINDTQRLLDSSLSRLSKYTGKSVSEKSLQNPFQGLNRSLLKKKYTLTEKQKNPTFLAQQAELDSKAKDVEAERAKQLPSIDLVGYATPDDQQVGLRFSWDVFNRATKYTVKEKDSLQAAAKSRLQRVIRDIEESARLATIEMKRSEVQLKTLKSQARETRKVVDFYKLQFSIARRSLIEVLNAEKELTDVELAQSSTQTQWNRAALNYLRSQGKIADWVGLSDVTPKDSQKNNVQFVDNKSINNKASKKLDEKLERETDKLLSQVENVKPNKKLSESIKTDKELLKKEIAELDKQATQLANKKVDVKVDKKPSEEVAKVVDKADNKALVKKADKVKAVSDNKEPISTDELTDKSIEKPNEKRIEKKGLMTRLLEKVGLGDDSQATEKTAEKVNKENADKSIELTSLDEDDTSVAEPVKSVSKPVIARPMAIKPSSIKESVVKKSSKKQPVKEKAIKEEITKKTVRKPIEQPLIERPVARPSIITKRDDKIVHLVAPEKLEIIEQAIASSSTQLPKQKKQVKKPIAVKKINQPIEKPVSQKVADKVSKPKVDLTSLDDNDVEAEPVKAIVKKAILKKERVVAKPIEKKVEAKIKAKVEKETKPKVKVAKVTQPVRPAPVKKVPEWDDDVDDNTMKSDDRPKINLIDEVDSTEHFKD